MALIDDLTRRPAEKDFRKVPPQVLKLFTNFHSELNSKHSTFNSEVGISKECIMLWIRAEQCEDENYRSQDSIIQPIYLISSMPDIEMAKLSTGEIFGSSPFITKNTDEWNVGS